MPTSIALTPRFEKLTKQLVASGEYNNVSEVVRDGLRLIEERKKLQKAKLKRLKEAIQVGVDALERGEYIEFKSEQELDVFFKQMALQTLGGKNTSSRRKAA
jgi:antitoxin ParD1/3/4